MAGLSNKREAAVLDTVFSGTLYLRLLTGPAGIQVNDDGSLPAGLTEIATGGYAPLSVPGAAWSAAVAGSPSTKTVPNAVHSPLTFTPTGAVWHICAYAWTTDANPITSTNFESGGVMVDVNGTPMLETVLDGQPFTITNQYPIVERLGDPPPATNPYEGPTPPPNVIFILTDDERFDWIKGAQLATRPIIQSRMLDKGTYFPNYRGNFNLCCPSRASHMTGQYHWNNNVFNEIAIDQMDYTSTWWTDAWGAVGDRRYQVCHIGKVLNGWGQTNWPMPAHMMELAFDEFYGFTINDQSKATYHAWEETFDVDGVSLGGSEFIAAYQPGKTPPNLGDYQTEYMTTKALGFLNHCVSRVAGDRRQNLPFFLTLSPTVGHTPFQPPPTLIPDLTNRAGRKAQYANWIRDLYDGRLDPNNQGVTPAPPGRTGTATATSATTVTDSGQAWAVNEFVGDNVTIGTAFGIVLSNTPTVLTIGEWLTVGSQDATNSWSLASTPAAGAYVMIPARTDIDQSDVHVQGTGGVYSANPGNNIKDERKTGQELVAADDLLETLCAFLETQTGQYSLDNTIIVYCSDNGLVRGEKGVWQDKGFPPDQNFRIPFIIRGPGITEGATATVPLCTVDIYPTLLTMMGVNMSRTADGIDMSGALKGDVPYPTTRAHLFNGNPSGSTHGVITSQWRYYHDTTPPSGYPQNMLFNWIRDPYELRNLWGNPTYATVQSDLVAMSVANYGVSAPGVAASLTYTG